MTRAGGTAVPAGPWRRRRAGLAVAALLAGLPWLAAGSASAAEADLQLSDDGVHYGAHPDGAVFDILNGYVPGETRSGTVWVRNNSNDAAVLSLGVKTAPGVAVLPGFMRMVAEARGSGTGPVPLAAPNACRTVAGGWSLGPGQALRMDLSLSLDLDAPNATRDQHAGFQLVFLLQGSTGAPALDACAGAALPPGAATSAATLTAVASTSTGASAGQLLPPARRDDYPAGAEHSNVVANNPRPAQLALACAAGLWLALRVRRRRTAP